MATNLVNVVSVQDGPQLTVNDIIKDPVVVPRRIIDITANRFIADQLLRKGPQAVSGVVKFYESNPLFAGTKSQVIGEFGQFPVTVNQLGQLLLSMTAKRGLGVRISLEMVNRNDIDAVNLMINQVSNTMVRDWDSVFMAASLAACAANGHTVAAGHAWTSATAKPRKDISSAKLAIVSATLPTQPTEYMGFTPNTLVLHVNDVTALESNDEPWAPWKGNVANVSPAVTGQLPYQLFGLDVWQTYHIAEGTALVLERQTIGGISDERPLQSTPLRFLEDTEEYRSNTVRQSAIFIDQPLAMCTITGIS